VIPPEVITGEAATVEVQIENIGGSEGVYTATLTVDGVVVEEKDVAVSPDTAETVSFQLVKETTGTYKIAIGDISSHLMVTEKGELKYDDGTPDGSYAMGGPGCGYLVQFSPPSTPSVITKVKMFGKTYKAGLENGVFDVQIWDSEQKKIYEASHSHTRFSPEPAWVEIVIPDVIVSGDFYIVVCTNTPQQGGVALYYDSSVKNEHSEVTRSWEIIHWNLSQAPRETTNWMIRVVNIPEEEMGAELKYDDGDSNGSCGSGSKGFSVHFSPTDTPYVINQVKIFANLLGTGYEDQKPRVEIWDKDFTPLHSAQVPVTEFTKDGSWAVLEIPNITVKDDFYVVFFTNCRKEGGVYIHFDSSVANNHSETVEPDGSIADWVWHPPKNTTNWMIRVVSSTE